MIFFISQTWVLFFKIFFISRVYSSVYYATKIKITTIPVNIKLFPPLQDYFGKYTLTSKDLKTFMPLMNCLLNLLVTSYITRAMSRVNSFCIKNIKKSQDLKVLGFFAKLYPRVLGVAATPDPRVIFIILIIILNLHDLSLSGSDCNNRPNSLGCGSGCKVIP